MLLIWTIVTPLQTTSPALRRRPLCLVRTSLSMSPFIVTAQSLQHVHQCLIMNSPCRNPDCRRLPKALVSKHLPCGSGAVKSNERLVFNQDGQSSRFTPCIPRRRICDGLCYYSLVHWQLPLADQSALETESFPSKKPVEESLHIDATNGAEKNLTPLSLNASRRRLTSD